VSMKRIPILLLCIVSLLMAACSLGKEIRTEDEGDVELPEGQYGVNLYEVEGPEGEWNVFVILDVEGDEYEFVPPALGAVIRKQEHVPAEEALEHAAIMIGAEPSRPYIIRRILSDDVAIGYELIPQDSYPTAKPVGNLLRIDYHLDPEGKVHFKTRVFPLSGSGKRPERE
jgi:hypothetical protein